MRLIVGLAALSLLAACSAQGEEKPTREELQAQVNQLRGQLSVAQEALDTVDSDLTDLQTMVQDFDDTNWREVVPQVRNQVEELDSSTSEALEALGCVRGTRCG